MPMDDPPPVGTLLELSISVSQRPTPILVRAEVVWQRPPPNGEIGAAFTDIDVADRDFLEGVVMKLLLEQRFAGY
jgi:hypothetical protein